jgi:chromosomal replication initiation ATPase DnaA
VLSDHQLAVRAVRRLMHAARAGVRMDVTSVLIHGGTGTGKSTLVRSIGRDMGDQCLVAQAKDIGRSVEAVDALVTPFLVIEDVHLAGADQAERLVTILDARSSRRRPTILTSAQPPADLTELPHRLTSRLAGGLVVAFPPLSAENRELMARKLGTKLGKPISKATAKRLAKAAGGSLRPMVGAIQQAAPGRKPRLPVAKAIQRIDEVAEAVAQAFGTDVATLRGPTQLRPHATARQFITALAFDHRFVTYRQLEDYFGRRGLSMARVLLESKLLTDQKLKLIYDRLAAELRRTAPTA